MAIIEVENLSFSYDTSEILRNLNLAVEAGSFLAIAGPNGAGKSTLINLLCGILKSDSGNIRIDGVDIKSYTFEKLARQVAVVRQEFVPVFGFSVVETVAMARTAFLGGMGFESKADREIVHDALEATDTLQFSDRPLGQLSGGERQRVFIARALAQQTPILLLDEPTNFLDLRHQVDIYDLLRKMQVEHEKTVVLISHDINVAAQYCDNILLLGIDKAYHLGTTEEIFLPKMIEDVFGVKGFAGTVGRERFFIPLGKFAKDKDFITKSTDSYRPD
jgi:iron complex transport system ATP-binding protein